MTIRIRIKRFIRRLLGQCIFCGKFKEGHKDCHHCNKDTRLCHFCNKRLYFARAYSMGKLRLERLLND